MSLPESIARRLQPGNLLRLFDLDLSVLTSKLTGDPGPVLYFHDGIAQGANLISFGGHNYSPFPINAEGFEWNTRGVLPRPSLAVSNIGSVVSALCREYGDLVGARLVLHQTFDIYIAGGAEAGPPWKEFTPIIFVVDRKSAENNTMCSFDLATGMDAEGVALPRRQILATACPFLYRGTECGYAAPASGGSGWPVTRRTGAVFQGGHFTNGVVPGGNLKLLQSATASFHTTPPELSDVGKVIFGTNFDSGTKVAAVNSATEVLLNIPAKAAGSGLTFDIVRTNGRTSGGSPNTLPLAYSATTTYSANDAVYVMVNGIRVYAVSKVGSNTGHSVYDENWWYLDVCLKKLSDCELHFGNGNPLPYGGFPGANRLQ